MTWTQITDKKEFITLAEKICGHNQARYSLLYGMSLDLDKYGSHYMLQYNDEALALQTNPNKAMVVSDLTIQASIELAKWIESHSDVKEIVGTKDTINQTLDQMRKTHPDYPELIMDQRIYELKQLDKPNKIKSKMVLATEIHFKLVQEWFSQFLIDAFIDTNPSKEKTKALAETRLNNKEVYLLIHEGNPVSMACSSRPTPDCITVNGVFTPIEYRRNGYAQEIVYLLSKELLKNYKSCCLYTDLANNTSNNIYQKVGFKPICDSLHYKIA